MVQKDVMDIIFGCCDTSIQSMHVTIDRILPQIIDIFDAIVFPDHMNMVPEFLGNDEE